MSEQVEKLSVGYKDVCKRCTALLRQRDELVELIEYASLFVPKGKFVSKRSSDWHFETDNLVAECKELT